VGFHPELIDALARQTSKRHQGIRVHQLPPGARYRDFVELLSKPDLRACIVIGLENGELLRVAGDHHVSFVSLFPQAFNNEPHTILIDPDEVVRLQLEHLLSLGHRQIAYMHRVDEKVWHRDHVLRRESFYKQMAEKGLPIPPNWVSYGDYTEEGFRRNFIPLFETSTHPTAVILADPNLPWAYRALKEKGLRVGKDVSLVGTDDLMFTEHLAPPATTLRVSRTRAAQQALKMLDRVLASEECPNETLDVELVVRKSTGPVLSK
jgi:DNA-binding LacI/PurR family transcriptional regulator